MNTQTPQKTNSQESSLRGLDIENKEVVLLDKNNTQTPPTLKDKIEEWIEQLDIPTQLSYSKDGKLQLQGLTIDKNDFDKLDNILKESIKRLRDEIYFMNMINYPIREIIIKKIDEIMGDFEK